LHGDGLPLQIPDDVDPVGAKEFKTADVRPRERDDGVSRLDPEDKRRSKVQGHVGFTGSQRLVVPSPGHRFDVLHLGEPLAIQAIFNQGLGGDTDGGNFDQLKLRRLGWRLRSDQLRVLAKEASGPRERQPTQESPPAERSSLLRTHGNHLSRCWSVRYREPWPVGSSALARIDAAPQQGFIWHSALIRPYDGDVIALRRHTVNTHPSMTSEWVVL